jgi:Rod binding domain-containing protein
VAAAETEDAKEAAEKAADAKARETAERLVAVVLVQPILKQVRESNQAAEPFKPTRGEQQFQGMLDAKLAQEITQSARFPLVERLAQDMRQQVRTDAQPKFTATA